MSDLSKSYIGKYVIVRTWTAGVHIGFLKEYDPEHRHCLLENCRRIWKWEGAFTLSEISMYGIKGGKLCVTIPEILITQVEELIKCSEKSEDNLKNFPTFIPG